MLPESVLAFAGVLVGLERRDAVGDVFTVVVRAGVAADVHAVVHVRRVDGREYHVQFHAGHLDLSKGRSENYVMAGRVTG